MKYSILVPTAISAVLVDAVFDANSNSNVAVYWGQASAGSQQSLATYCQSSDVDVILLSFLHSFPDNLNLHFTSDCATTFHSGLLHCEAIANDIKTCQNLGKKVLLSIGGSTGLYGFQNDNQASEFATTLWNTFAGGSSTERPFNDAVVDGFDFDIENRNATGYSALAKTLKDHFSKANKPYYLSAAPQCFYPDASVGDLLASVELDFIFIQFYNNACNVDAHFNWDTWAQMALTGTNSKAKLFLGLAGSPSAAASGYLPDLDKVRSTIDTISKGTNFGGIMLWDASQGFANQVDGKSYVTQMKGILDSVRGNQHQNNAENKSSIPGSSNDSSSGASTSTVTEYSTSTSVTSALNLTPATNNPKHSATRVSASQGSTTESFLTEILRFTKRALF
ncbi:LAFA_0F14554g1_1 [Lachancea sp. 'fantastica']|nr:LAFA_0F14554g1_1 [Lachancea sp. 'fantastica']